MIRCVVFDFDGTLVDSNKIKIESFSDAVENLGDYRKIVDEVITFCKGDRYSIINEIVEKIEQSKNYPSDFTREKWRVVIEKNYSTICEKKIICCSEIQGASETLKCLKNMSILLMVNSSTPENYLKRIVKLRNLDHFFNCILGGHGNKVKNLNYIKEQYNLQQNEIIHVGDGEDDLIAANEFGCHFVGIINNQRKLDGKTKNTISNLTELISIVGNSRK